MAVSEPREAVTAALADVLRKYSTSVLKDPTRLKNLLSDRCGQYRGEINTLTGALAEGALEHVGNPGELPRDDAVAKLAAHLEPRLGVSRDAAAWAARTWFDAVNAPEARKITIEMLNASVVRRHRLATRHVATAVATLALTVLIVAAGVAALIVWRWQERGLLANPFEPALIAVVAGLAIKNRWSNLTFARAVEASARVDLPFKLTGR